MSSAPCYRSSLADVDKRKRPLCRLPDRTYGQTREYHTLHEAAWPFGVLHGSVSSVASSAGSTAATMACSFNLTPATSMDGQDIPLIKIQSLTVIISQWTT